MNRLAACLALLWATTTPAADPPKLELKDGDRIVYLGNAFAERDANYGYFEMLLTARNPDITFTFRNLGWSGDTVWGDARARFGTRADGFAHLKEHVLALKPTVLLVAYGMNESFAGEPGLKEFEAGLNSLLDTLGETKARIFLVAPILHEDVGRPLPDPARHNADLKLYRDRLAALSKSRKLGFCDPEREWAETAPEGVLHRTDDGLHPTACGYAAIADAMLGELLADFRSGHRVLVLGEGGGAKFVEGWTVSDLRSDDRGYSFTATARSLPDPPHPEWRPGLPSLGGGMVLRLDGLETGRYTVKIDGEIVHQFEADKPIQLVGIRRGPEVDQVERLRAAINKKNELYFHRWRPQNETYLFGFRKHEQGNNAVEIPRFDPLVAELEAEIGRLKKPAKHTYELSREEAKR